MDDQQILRSGQAGLVCLSAGISAEKALQLSQLLARYRKAKEECSALVADVDAVAICGECAGQCCLNGKYRLNVLDALARTAAGVPTPADFTRKPVCPYGGDAGCTMEPGLRPADCVLFICDAIDAKLSLQARKSLDVLEREVRECIQIASDLTGERMGTPLLLWGGKIIAVPK